MVLKKSYEDLVVFHNKIVSNKVTLISKDLEKGMVARNDIKKQIDALHVSETTMFRNISEPDTLKAIGQVYNDLSKVKEQIASVNALLAKIEDTDMSRTTIWCMERREDFPNSVPLSGSSVGWRKSEVDEWLASR